MISLPAKRLLLTGGTGFLGRHVARALQDRGCRKVTSVGSADCDLTSTAETERLFRETKPEVVIHLAALVGGIEASRRRPADLFYGNLMIGAVTLEQARKSGVEKFVGIGTISSYPRHTPVPFKEEDLWNGYPEETHAPYGLAKRMLLAQGQLYRQQYGMNVIHLMPVNLYGPGDQFEEETAPVVPALIRRCVEAVERGEPRLICWGDGSPTREFLYVEDCAEGIVLAAERYDGADPVNLGSGVETPIRELVRSIAEPAGFRGEIAWDRTKPNGQPRRCLDVSRAKRAFGFQARTSLEEGLRETIRWYQSQRKERLNQRAVAPPSSASRTGYA